MSLGVVMLVHTALGRAEQVARHWASAGCPVVIHVDKSVDKGVRGRFAAALSDIELVRFSKRYRCEWGTWGIVAATQSAADLMLQEFPLASHVFLASGACLPLRPVEELIDYLAKRPQTDFIESVTTADVPWTIGGLEEERFTLHFPFAWKKRPYLFDRYVKLQRRLGVARHVPDSLVPHMGSQWWCLSRRTLSAILNDPARAAHDRYFRRVWIPDESYFQTLARHHAIRIESRSLTLSKFDYQGKPHIFYDDHLQLLRRSDCFVARKIWPHAHKLYDTFLAQSDQITRDQEPKPGKIDRLFAKAVGRRVHGRPGLYMQSRFPRVGRENGVTAAPFSMFQGFSEVFEDFETWLAKATGARVHGRLFAPDRAHFAGGHAIMNGALSDNATLRDHNPHGFLTNLIWNTRGERQCFQFCPLDNQKITAHVARDPNAQISVISGAWAVPLFRSRGRFADLRRKAARMQKIESKQLTRLRSAPVKARVRIWTMADFVEAPMAPLQSILEEIGSVAPHGLSEAPRMVDLSGFGQFLQDLKNQGMHPYLMGDFPVVPDMPEKPRSAKPRPYVVR